MAAHLHTGGGNHLILFFIIRINRTIYVLPLGERAFNKTNVIKYSPDMYQEINTPPII